METSERTRAITVLIADDHRMFAEALQAILSADERIRVVGTAADGREAVEAARAALPDIVLMDISMPVMDGFAAAAEIQATLPGTTILMLTGSNSPADVDRARQAGVAGYVTKDAIAARLLDAIIEAAPK